MPEKSVKLHIGCGTVYLKDWVNIDLPGERCFLAKERPDLVRKYITTDDKYFARHEHLSIETLREPQDQDYVCDTHGSFDNLPAAYWSVNEVLARHSFEHLSIREAHRALDQIDSVMEPNGILRIDVPDHEKTLQLFHESGDRFYIRHLLGPRRNDFGFHLMSYTPDRLRRLVEDHGFIFVEEEPNIHLYPAFCLRFVKPGPRAPREYAWPPPFEIPADWRVLDVGPGTYPLPRADAYLDREWAHLTDLKGHGKKVFPADIEGDCSKVETKSFDFVWCSHCLEHLQNPLAAAANISRIGKRGAMIVPSSWKEGIFQGDEADHKWQCLPNPTEGGPPIFVRNNREAIARLQNPAVQQIMSRLWRTGPNRIEEARVLRRWFYENERSLDIVHFWQNELKLVVID